jgi:hypothetical protein
LEEGDINERKSCHEIYNELYSPNARENTNRTVNNGAFHKNIGAYQFIKLRIPTQLNATVHQDQNVI